MLHAYFKNKQTVSIDPVSVLLILAMFGSFYFLFLVKNIIIMLSLAFIVSVAMNPLVIILQKKLKTPKPIAIALAYVFLLIVVISFVGLVIPPLAHQFIGFVAKLDLPGLNGFVSEINFTLQEASELVSRVTQSASVAFGLVSSTFSGIFNIVTLFVLSFYLMLERDNLHKKVYWFTKDKKVVDSVEHFISSAEEQLGGWVRGQLLLMLVIGITTFIGLTILKIPYALPLALLAGLLEILPNLGPVVSAVPAVAIAFLTFGPVSGLVVVVFYIIVQQVENNVLVPKIMAANAQVNPLIAIITILIGFEIGSVTGAFLAIPVYIVLRLLFSTFRNHLLR
ncbi:MAG: AI-2E family transporter [Pseudomonadales bacterium]|nr:AI-2E family transporter [Candidatus Woesebacteria bacterium]MCB9801199.1 AI-2E family transporter [Pseudomonadales bacterium]